MELKLGQQNMSEFMRLSFNRTFMELKLQKAVEGIHGEEF